MQPLRHRLGRFELLTAERVVLKDGAPVPLGPRAFDVLLALVERRGQLVTKNELLEAVWPGVFVEENNLQAQVSAIRKILGRDAIATIPGRGYQLTIPPEEAAEPSLPAASPPAPAQTNLPGQLPPIYGRAAEISAVTALLGEHRLVSIVGPAGIGKTRLSQSVAFNLAGEWPDGAWIVELAGTFDAAAAHSTIAKAVGVTLDPRRPPEQALIDGLRKRWMLLVLDNCEHLLEPVAAFVRALLERAPGIRLMITSQARLRLPDEQIVRLEGLSLPATDDTAQLPASGALALFTARASASLPGFRLTPGNLRTVIHVCQRLDGNPLALELAASRLPLLGIEGLEAHLDDRFKVLTGGLRAGLERHQALRSALDWSHDLLTPDEQTVFRRLGVFAGDFSLELARTVASDNSPDGQGLDGWAIVELLATLIERSLVVAGSEPTPRYYLLETMRAYALQQLELRGEREILERRHALAVRAVFERMDAEWFQNSADTMRERHARELNNLRAAADWAVAAERDGETAVALAADSTEIWLSTGLIHEGLQRWLRAQPCVARAAPAVQARYWLAGTPYYRWWSDGRAAGENAIRLARELGDDRRLYVALAFAASHAAHRGDEVTATRAVRELETIEHADWPLSLRVYGLEARAHTSYMAGCYEETLAVARRMAEIFDATGNSRGKFTTRMYIANVTFTLDRYREAVRLGRELRDEPHASRYDLYGIALFNLIEALLFAGEPDEAQRTARQLLAGRPQFLVGLTLCLALLAAERGRFEDAARLLGHSRRVYADNALPLEPAELKVTERVQGLLRAALSAEDFGRLTAEGARLDEPAAFALSGVG